MKWPFFLRGGGGGGVSGPFLPQIGSSLLKFRPEVVFHKKKIVSEQSFKIKCLSGNRTYPKLTVLVHFGTNLPLENPKYCQKNKFSQKLHPYDCQIAHPRSQINHRILIKLIKKTGGGAKMDFLR